MSDPSSGAVSRVCVLALDTIGDLVLRQPMLTAICDAGHQTAIVVRPAYAPLVPILDARLRVVVSEVHPFHSRSFAQELEALRKTLAAVEAFAPDWLIASAFSRTWADEWLLRNAPWARRVGFRGKSVLSQLDGEMAGLAESLPIPVAAMLDREVIVEPDSPDSEKAERLVESLAELHLGSLEAPHLRIDAQARASADAILAALGITGRYALMVAAGTANNPLKAMPVELARSAVDHLFNAHGMVTLLTGVESEAPHLAAVASGMDQARVWIGRDADLAAMVGLVSRAAVYVGADSGPMHLAAACGLPVVAVFGGGHWPRFVPHSAHAVTVHNPMPCYGCGWACKWSRPLCITTIRPRYVADAIDASLSGNATPVVMEGASSRFLDAMAQVVESTEPVREESARMSTEIFALHGRLAHAEGDRTARGAQVEQLTGLLREAHIHREELDRQVTALNAHARLDTQRAAEVEARMSESEDASRVLSAEMASLHARLVHAEDDRAARGLQIEQLTAMLRESDAHREELHRQVTQLNAHARRMEQFEHAARRAEELAAKLRETAAALEEVRGKEKSLEVFLQSKSDAIVALQGQVDESHRRIEEMSAAVADAVDRSSALDLELQRARDEIRGLEESLRSASVEAQRRREAMLALADRFRAVVGRQRRSTRISASDRNEIEQLIAKAADQSSGIALRHVLVDLTPMLPGGHNGGAKVFVISLLRALAKLSRHTKFTLLANVAVREELRRLPWPPNVILDFGSEDGSRTWLRNVRAALARGRRRLDESRAPSVLMRATGWARRRAKVASPEADLLFCPFTAPYYHDVSRPTVCVVYDIQHEVYPQFFTADEGVERRRSVARACAQSAAVATISDFVRRSLLERGAIAADRLATIHICPSHDEPPSAQECAVELGECGLAPERFFLYPANFWPHKNHAMLLAAFAIAARRGLPDDIKLVLTGELNARARELRSGLAAMGLEGRVLFAGFVSPRRLAALRLAALCVVFPSLYEGFGMPVVEAMADGTPVACGDATALAEVAGNAAAMFDSRDPEAIAAALVRVSREPDMREALRQAGRARVAELGTEAQMAGQYLELFRRALAKGGGTTLLRGVHADGWSGPVLSLTYGRGAPGRTVTFDVFAPGWLPHGRVAISCGLAGRSMDVKTGTRESLQVALSEQGGTIEVKIRPYFRPDRLISGSGDGRQLGVMVEGAVLRGGGEETSLLDTAVAA